MKILQMFFLFFLSISSYSQNDLGWKTILNEQFKNNNNGWQTESNDLRYPLIANGQLIDSIDRFSEKGAFQIDRISVSFNSIKDHTLSFSMANLNGDASKKYRVYEKRRNGTLDTWENNPTWGFVWGFKDWENYNCILFNNNKESNTFAPDNYLYNTLVKVYYKSNSITTTVLDWKKIKYIGTNANNISIEQLAGNTVRIYSDESLIYSNSESVFQWYGDKIGPYTGSGAKIALNFVKVTEKKPHPKTNWTENSLKSYWTKNGIDAIEGIYESAISTDKSLKYELAVVKSENGYKLIYMGGTENSDWVVGDIKAYLTKTANSSLYKVEYFMGDKSINENLYISFENALMKVIWTDRQENLYIKLYPTSGDIIKSIGGAKSSGTGFALSSNGYIVTNYHVTNGASSIKVKGIKGDFSKTYNAKVIIEDKNNDLSIIEIDDPNFTSLGTLPYKINNSIIDVGNSVYALGYPLRATMGDEVKLTNGIISSKTGFQGDIAAYQISVPVQPGNSGGPLFNSNGDVIGIINAKHLGAENASYAIKTSYLMNVIQVMDTQPKLSEINILSKKSLSDQVKYIKEFVYIIEIN